MNKKTLSMEERKRIPTDCPYCGKTFKNVFATSSHKGFCNGTRNLNHFDGKRGWSKGKILTSKEELFLKYSKHNTAYVRKALLKLKIKEYKCEECDLEEWNNKKITLELDHINGDNRDNRLENLRFLCPNCHSQTLNWRGRNTNTGKVKVSDEVLIEALKANNNRQALIKVGLTAKGANYHRCNLLRERIGLAGSSPAARTKENEE
jgi:Zn finger protein HypA/HybF involved in hydrogenase expression